jgi:hypothetical protein
MMIITERKFWNLITKSLTVFNSIQFFIINVLHQQPEGQLQMQHKRRQNNKYNKITTIRLSINYMTIEKVNTQRQLVTGYINTFGIIIRLN